MLNVSDSSLVPSGFYLPKAPHLEPWKLWSTQRH